jgi:hypothetical protein
VKRRSWWRLQSSPPWACSAPLPQSRTTAATTVVSRPAVQPGRGQPGPPSGNLRQCRRRRLIRFRAGARRQLARAARLPALTQGRHRSPVGAQRRHFGARPTTSSVGPYLLPHDPHPLVAHRATVPRLIAKSFSILGGQVRPRRQLLALGVHAERGSEAGLSREPRRYVAASWALHRERMILGHLLFRHKIFVDSWRGRPAPETPPSNGTPYSAKPVRSTAQRCPNVPILDVRPHWNHAYHAFRRPRR